MPEPSMWLRYAMAVSHMRRLQRQWIDSNGTLDTADLAAAEREVDELTTLHLLPSALQEAGWPPEVQS